MNAPRKEEQVDKLERALRRAHEAREAPHFSRTWIDDVMRDVRRCRSPERTVADVPDLVWRAAAIIAVFSTLFVGSVLTWTARQSDLEPSALLTMTTADSNLLTGDP